MWFSSVTKTGNNTLFSLSSFWFTYISRNWNGVSLICSSLNQVLYFNLTVWLWISLLTCFPSNLVQIWPDSFRSTWTRRTRSCSRVQPSVLLAVGHSRCCWGQDSLLPTSVTETQMWHVNINYLYIYEFTVTVTEMPLEGVWPDNYFWLSAVINFTAVHP